MPSYKNRIPMDPNTPVWRYTSLDAVIAMLRDRTLRLTRVDTFRDPFEGSVPKQMYDDQVALFSSVYNVMDEDISAPDPWTVTTLRRLAMTRSAHASCWSYGDESEALWRLYCADSDEGQGDSRGIGVGLALRSHLAKLEASVAHLDLYVSPVAYRFYHIGPAFTDELDAFMHKRQGFECEREVRLLKFDVAHYHALNSPLPENPERPLPPELPAHRFLDWSLVTAIDGITISPYASEDYEQKARQATAGIDPSITVELSVLSDRLYKPNF